MMSRRLLGIWALLCTVASGCSETYSDEAFGVLVLDAVLGEGIPERISPEAGFEGGSGAEYYNFGQVAVQTNAFGEPLTARVNPMYFFFTPDGLPLMAPVVRERRTRQDFVNGGHNVLDVNPKDFCAVAGADPVSCKALNDRQLDRIYSLRFREPLVDPLRNVADYQRPIVDVSPGDAGGTRAFYTGLWEIVEVTVPDDYRPDSVKHWSTLKRAIDNDDFRVRRTGKVINCPIIDERTEIPQGVADAATFRPRMEIWYRRKLAYCYLADGWLTLADSAGNRIAANRDAQRLDTFDVSRVISGQGKAQQQVVVVPVGKAYVPSRVLFDEVNGTSRTRVGGQVLSAGRPRRSPSDPTGYTPIRWLWDINVEGEFREDVFDDVAKLDEAGQARPRRPQQVVNLSLRGVQIPCSLPKLPKLIDGRRVNLCGVDRVDASGNSFVDASGDPACQAVGLECNRTTCFCDAPPVKYGQRCGIGIARCDETPDGLSEEGYSCFPANVGFCYLGCDPSASNTLARQNRGREPKDFVDSRCKELPGYTCFPYFNRGICLRFCDENVLDTDTMKQCRSVTDVRNGAASTPVDLGAGQICQNFGVQICAWPDDYTPR